MASKALTLPDEEVVRRFQRTGDNECFAEVFIRYRKKVFFACRRFFSDGPAAEDATQETFLRAYRNIHSFQGGDFSAWLMRIARNVCIDEWRSRRSERRIGGEELTERPAGVGLDSLSEVHRVAEKVWQEMKCLPREQRQCLELKIEGYSYEETAARTGSLNSRSEVPSPKWPADALEENGGGVVLIEMSGWNEENFLEGIMPLLKKTRGPDSCPDAETLCAVIDGGESDALRDDIAAHITRCPACADLHQRLRAFDRVNSPEQETGWKESERRLDNWLESFLGAGVTPANTADRAAPSGFVLWWRDLTKPLLSWKMQLALGTAAALALGAGIYVMRRASSVPVQIAGRATPRQEQTSNPTPTKNPVENHKPENRIAQGTKLTPKHARTVRQNPPPKTADSDMAANQAGPKEPAFAHAAVPPPVEDDRTTQTAKAIMPPPPNSSERSRASSLAQMAPPSQTEPQVTPLQVAQPAQDNRTTQTAEAVTPSPSIATGPRAVYPVRMTPSSTLKSRMTSHAPQQASSPAAPPPVGVASAPPSFLRIEAETRIWIQLKSVSRQAGGSFEFAGIVLLPVMQAGTVLLDRDAETHGSGTVSQGRTSIRIDELVIRGACYRLKGINGAMNAQTPGAGRALQFDAGKVLEVWVGSPSMYERVISENHQPRR